jgi:hypothetical protein
MPSQLTAPSLSLEQLNRATLARQLLLERAPVSCVAAVERLCGLQAQEPAPPFVGLWSRVRDFETGQLHEALHARELVRATLMRGTLHLVSADDFAAMRAPLQPVLSQAMRALGSRAEGLELDEVLPAARALLDERPRNFNELRALLVQAFPGVNERALGYATRMSLPLVMVPTSDRWAFPAQADFTLAETWLARELSDDGAPDALVRRYLAAFGPATAADAMAWSGLKGLGPVIERMRPSLRVFRGPGGRELFDLADAARPGEDVVAPARLLPEFDSLVLAHADRSRLIADEHRSAIVTKNLRVRATFLLDGFVAGTWAWERKKKSSVALRLTPFARLPKRSRTALVDEAQRLLAFAEPGATTTDVTVDDP